MKNEIFEKYLWEHHGVTFLRRDNKNFYFVTNFTIPRQLESVRNTSANSPKNFHFRNSKYNLTIVCCCNSDLYIYKVCMYVLQMNIPDDLSTTFVVSLKLTTSTRNQTHHFLNTHFSTKIPRERRNTSLILYKKTKIEQL